LVSRGARRVPDRQAGKDGAGWPGRAHNHRLEVTVLDLSRLLTQAEKILERVLRSDIILTIETPAFLYRVKADPEQIERVIINLPSKAPTASSSFGMRRSRSRCW
jgi:signal transduction histidine kinase